jgi:outer membrane protein assembly factor BamB
MLLALLLVEGGACRRAPPGEKLVDPLAGVPERALLLRTRVAACGAPTRPAAVGPALVWGCGGGFHGVDLDTGKLLWSHRAAAAVYPPVVHKGRLFLPWLEGRDGIVAEVDPATGVVLRRTLVRVTASDWPGGIPVDLNTAPAVGGGFVVWPSSRLLFAFSLQGGKRRWVYEATGPTPLRRFHFGSDPPLLDETTVYWGHQQGVAAVDLHSGRERWSWPAYRGFALRPLLAPEALFVSSDAAVQALDRRNGKLRWQFAPEGLRFERLAAEDISGLYRHSLWFVGETSPFRYHLFYLDRGTGHEQARTQFAAGAASGSVASDPSHLYVRTATHLVACDLASARPVWRVGLALRGASPPTVASGRVWVVDADGTVVAVATGAGQVDPEIGVHSAR